MKDRIKEFIEHKGISAGELATRLDVQRSNISHILNGRNKPGAALIEKLLMVFPDLNARWLLTGEGNMIDKDIKGIETFVTKPVSEPQPNKIVSPPPEKRKDEDKPIDKVVLLYKDGTFSAFSNK